MERGLKKHMISKDVSDLFFKFNIYHPRPALALGRFKITHLHHPSKISLYNCF